jgi:fatty-acyl-CoA synthase
MSGYFREPNESAKVLNDGWLDTGDLGYWFSDEIVVTGRAKDLIIVNGRNIWPQDIEWAVETLHQLRRGDACAFSVESADGESVILIVQYLPSDLKDRESLIGDVRQIVKEAVGIDCQIVLISRQVGLPLTSSGKLSRVRAKSRFIAGGYIDVQGATELAIPLVA